MCDWFTELNNSAQQRINTVSSSDYRLQASRIYLCRVHAVVMILQQPGSVTRVTTPSSRHVLYSFIHSFKTAPLDDRRSQPLSRDSLATAASHKRLHCLVFTSFYFLCFFVIACNALVTLLAVSVVSYELMNF